MKIGEEYTGPSLASVPLRGTEDRAQDDSFLFLAMKQRHPVGDAVVVVHHPSLENALASARTAVRTPATVAAATAPTAPVPASPATTTASWCRRLTWRASPHFRRSRRHNRLPHFQRRPGISSWRILDHAAPAAGGFHLGTRHRVALVLRHRTAPAIHTASTVHTVRRAALDVPARSRREVPPAVIVGRSRRRSRVPRPRKIVGGRPRRHTRRAIHPAIALCRIRIGKPAPSLIAGSRRPSA